VAVSGEHRPAVRRPTRAHTPGSFLCRRNIRCVGDSSGRHWRRHHITSTPSTTDALVRFLFNRFSHLVKPVKCPCVGPCGVNIFRTRRFQNRWAEVDETQQVFSMGLGTKLLGSGIFNFGPCAARGHPEPSPVETEEMTHPEGSAYAGAGAFSFPIPDYIGSPKVSSKPWSHTHDSTATRTHGCRK